jgi:hypothetical protein
VEIVNNHIPRITSLLAAGLMAAACAGPPRPHTETPARVKDSGPEKIAAQRAATPGLGLERDDERWGFEAARERRRLADQRKQVTPASHSAPGPVDVHDAPK